MPKRIDASPADIANAIFDDNDAKLKARRDKTL